MYINTETLDYLTEQQIRTSHPNTSFGSVFIPPDEYSSVFPSPQPEHNPIVQRVQEVKPELTTKGHWEQKWEIIPLYSTTQEETAAIAANAEAQRIASVPAQVTMRQARLALLGAGKLAQVTAAINSLPSPQKEAAGIEWEYSQTVERHRGFVLLLGAAIGLSALDLDNLFIAAAAL